MDLSFDAEVQALQAAAAVATRSREGAHEAILQAFRGHVHAGGPGPSEDLLQSYARLLLVERALEKELGLARDLAVQVSG